MRYWSLLFGLSAVFAVGLFLYAPFDPDWWLPNYEATNAESLTTLEHLERDAEAAVERVLAIQGQVPEGVDAEGLNDLEEIEAQLAQARIRLDRLVDSGFLPTRLRSSESLAFSASTAVREARGQLQTGSPDAAGSLRVASENLERYFSSITEALASIPGADGSLTGPVSSVASDIDHLFILILGITGVTFIGVMIALVWATWRFATGPGRQAQYYHGSQRLEVVWTIIPTAILVFIALYQLGTWAEIKFRSNQPKVRPLAEVTARQFQWVIRYPGPDGKLNTADDLFTINDLHFVKDTPVLIYLKAEDVLHSFFLPQLRIKQDAVPGLTIPVWFDVNKPGHYELLCAELCGWGHYKMRANVTVHETQSEFDEWMENALREQNRDQLAAADGSIVE